MKSISRYAGVAVFAAMLLMGSMTVTSCSGKKDSAAKAAATTEEELPRVEVSRVEAREVAQTTEYTATVEAFKTNNITTSTPNRIKSILVDVGAHVSKGQKVVVLDDVNIEQLRVRLENTERQYKRALQLYEIGGGTQQSVEQLKTEYDAGKRQYDNMVENTVLRSPISGVVTARNYDPGDMTSAQPILTVEQINPVKIVLHVSESEYSRVSIGMPADIRLDSYPGREFTGKVSLIYPTVDPSTRTFQIEITLPDSRGEVLPGMFARVTMNYGMAEHVVVPDRAIVKQPGSGNRFVYVYNPSDGTVDYRKVELGRRLGDSYELLDGVESGSEVVVTGQVRLADGVKVEVLNNKSTEKTQQ